MQNETVEHEKIFRLEKSTDPNQLKAIRLREQVCDDRNLSDGAVRLFVRLLDLSLNPILNGGGDHNRGKIIISQTKLGCMINCDERTVRRRGTELIEGNYVWTSMVPGIGTKPITAYHVTAFFPRPKVAEHIPGSGLFGNGKRRHDHGFEKTGMGATGRQRRVDGGLLDRFGKQVFLNYLENEPVRGLKVPVTEDKTDRSQRTPASSDRGQSRPLTEDTSVLSQRSKLTAPSGQNCPVTQDATVRHIESQLQSEGQIQRSKSISKRLSGPGDGETDFLERMTRLCGQEGPKMLAKFGGQWRACHREDRETLESAFAEVRSMKVEGREVKNAGAYVMLLYRQWRGNKTRNTSNETARAAAVQAAREAVGK